MKKKCLYGIIALLVFCALAFGLWRVWQSSLPETAEGSKTVTVAVTHADGSMAEFTYQTELEYLGELLQQEGLISGSAGDYGLFVETVDGETPAKRATSLIVAMRTPQIETKRFAF